MGLVMVGEDQVLAFDLDDAAQMFGAALASVRDDLQAIERKSQDQILLKFTDGDSITFFLGNLLAEINACSDGPAEKLQRYVGTISSIRARQALGSSAFDESDLIPMIRNTDYVSQLRAVANESSLDGDTYHFRNIAADYWIILALDSETCTTPMRRSMLPMDTDVDSLFAKAAENFRHRFLPTLKVEDLGQIKMLSGSGDYEASVLAIDQFWRDAADSIGGGPLAVALSKDVLLYCSKTNEDGVARLKRVIEDRGGSFAYSISTKLLEWTETGWVEASA